MLSDLKERLRSALRAGDNEVSKIPFKLTLSLRLRADRELTVLVCQRLCGPPEAVPSGSYCDRAHPGDRERLRKAFADAARADGLVTLRHRFVARDRTFPVQLRGYAICFGQPACFDARVRNISRTTNQPRSASRAPEPAPAIERS